MNKINPPRSASSTWVKVRKLFNDLHLWLGIGAGLILTVVCLTGTILAFEDEIKRALNPDLFVVEVPEEVQRLDIETLSDKLYAQLPEGGKILFMNIPEEANATYKVYHKIDGERRGVSYLANPYTGELLGSNKAKGHAFFDTVFKLHRWLLLDIEVGRPIVGVATIIFFFIIISGWVIWFPKKLKNWRQGLKIKWNANWKRVNFDLHSALGFYASFFLLLMALTGLKWSFKWYKEGVTDLLSSKKVEKIAYEYTKKATDTPLSFETLLAKVNEQFPHEGEYRVYFDDNENGTIRFNKYKSGFFAPTAPDKVKLNKYTGEVVDVQIFADQPLGDKIVQSLYPIHVGSFYGMFTRILYFIACAIATTLPITGIIIWINKLKKKAKKSAKQKVVI